ncbi:PhzF family phenazine biosynthesis protein [Chondromyces apiculatus]|uniref:Phenazine biosynthesis protein PhzF like protein n=1 Tax=Chondromyces apiculatus DSM 436 TaxID=1192034 RepID=A0A017SWU3_9BACT|nr:PhzF family phenazine biosynthesis protein [Chondromyces apiculatus]EYF01438.1 Phenazine biosynthesis protein PhzF like protein [Chondromyces apiculatus DSM 436]
MAELRYVTVDVFTSRRFGGNPLAVIPDARGLDAEVMQRIAAEFNYSESTFVLPPRDPAHTAEVRIFSPTRELPFAGHPNVGTAFVLGRQGALFGREVGNVMRFEEGAGLVEVALAREGDAVVGARIEAPRALEVGPTVDAAAIAACACLPLEAVVTERHAPCIASVGLSFVLAEVRDLAALAAARPSAAAFADADARYPRADDRLSLFLYTRDTRGSGDGEQVRARMFAPLSNIVEDPATGSASGALGAFLTSRRPEADVEARLTITQGVEMGRPSTIEVAVRKTGGVVQKVAIGGQCVPVMSGALML